jgi:hypothetical protein
MDAAADVLSLLDPCSGGADYLDDLLLCHDDFPAIGVCLPRDRGGAT